MAAGSPQDTDSMAERTHPDWASITAVLAGTPDALGSILVPFEQATIGRRFVQRYGRISISNSG
jgi:hypothetical protein